MIRRIFGRKKSSNAIYKPTDEGAINVSDVEFAFNKSSSKRNPLNLLRKR
jgi:hypothetical protein